MIVFANAYHQRAALACRNQRVRLALIYQHNGVCANNLVEGIAHCRYYITMMFVLIILNELHQNFCVCGALEGIALDFELIAQN